MAQSPSSKTQTLLSTTQTLSAQEATDTVANLINLSRYEELYTILPSLKDSLPQSIATLSEAITASHYGRHFESTEAVKRIITDYSETFGDEVVIGMLNLSAYNYRALNDYDNAAKAIQQLLSLIPPQNEAVMQSLSAYLHWMKQLAQWPVTTIKRHNDETIIPLEIRTVGRGENLLVYVEMNGQTEKFIFDTGCSGSNIITEATAQRLGVRIIADSIIVSGMVRRYAKVGVADSLHIGTLTVFHPTFMVLDEIQEEEIAGASISVLGTDIIRNMGEIRFEAYDSEGQEARIVLPPIPSASPAIPNLSFSNGAYFLTFQYGEEKLTALFDSGNVKSTLSYHFCSTHL